MRHRYPFETLQWLRHQRVDREAALVGERAARTARARADEVRAQLVRRVTEQRIDELARAERAGLDAGTLRAGELARAGEWRRGADAELQSKVEREARAAEAVQREAAAETVARRALGAASREAELIDTHGAHFRASCEAARERAEEEAAVEQWTAQRQRPRG